MRFFLSLATIVFSLNAIAFGISATDIEDSMVAGHSVYVGKTCDDSTNWKYELLRNAKKSIEMSCGYTNGMVFANVYSILKEQLETNPDIKIYIMVAQHSGLFTDENKDLLHELSLLYPNNFHYLITGGRFQIVSGHGLYCTENHTKMIVVDEKYFHLGGTNLADRLSRSEIPEDEGPSSLPEKFLPKAACDQDVVVSGPMAKKLREEFYQIFTLYRDDESIHEREGPYYAQETDYRTIDEKDKCYIPRFENHPDLIRNVKVYGLISGPRFNYHEMGDIYAHYIKHAQKSLDIAQMYFFPVEKIYDLFIDAAKRDVKIRVITNGMNVKADSANSTILLYVFMNRVNYLPVMLGNTYRFWQKREAYGSPLAQTSIYEYAREYMLYHKKVIIIDNQISIVGSYNLNKKSENSDFEVCVFMDSPAVAQQLHDNISIDQTHSAQVTFRDALDYYFSFAYNLLKKIEDNLCDGIIVGVGNKNENNPKINIEIKLNK